jgi:Thoeris protein ThsB, TIR-like domain
MSYNVFGSGLRSQQPVKRKVFVSYHHRGDQDYYDAFSKTFCDTYDVITDNSLERRIDSEDVNYVIRRIREGYVSGSSCTIVLVGKDTWGRKYVDWEIQATLEKKHGLIGVRLPTAPITPQNTVSMPGRLFDNIKSGYALWLTWQELTSGSQACSQYIEQANARDKMLIVNTRERRLRNG